jgi:hypothetical protein
LLQNLTELRGKARYQEIKTPPVLKKIKKIAVENALIT